MAATLEEIFAQKPPAGKPSLEDIFAKKEDPSTFAKALDYGGRALDYMGGLSRTGLAMSPTGQGLLSLAGLVSGKPGAGPRPEDFEAALVGKAPTSAEYLERAGVPEGGSLSDVAPGLYSEKGDEWLKLQKGGMLDPTARGAAGFAADIATDPATYLTGGLSALSKKGATGGAGEVAKKGLMAAIDPVSSLMGPAGKKLFKSGVKELDEVALLKGKKPVSDVLIEYGISGTKKKIANKAADLSNELFEKRQALLKQADMDGARVDFGKLMRLFEDKARAALIDPDPVIQDVGKAMLGSIKRYGKAGVVTVQKASQMKTNLYNLMPESTWEIMKRTPEGGKFLTEMAGGIRGSIEEAVERAGGQKGLLQKINDDLGTLLTTKKVMGKAASKEVKRPFVSAIDGMILASSHPHVILGKRAAEIAKTSKFRTNLGMKMMGRSGLQRVTRPIKKRGLINLLKGEEEQ